MKINVTDFHFKELILKGYSLDHIFLLRLINEQNDLSALLSESAKLSALHQSLMRKGLISEKEDKLTVMGTELLVFMDTKAPDKLVRRKVDETSFSEWWKAFPGTDTFEYKGKSFVGGRSLRKSEDDCRIKFDKILLEGEYSVRELIDSMKLDVIQKKELSIKKNENKLSYMQNSLTYLNQRSYEPFIELLRKGFKVEESQETFRGGTDI